MSKHHGHDADQIHKMGLEEVARIRGLMEQAIAATDFKGTFPEFLKMLRTDPRFYARTPAELLEKASEIAKRADDQLPRLFGTLPRLPYGVRPVPAEMAEGYTTGRYWQGSMRWGRPAVNGELPQTGQRGRTRCRRDGARAVRVIKCRCAVAGAQRAAVLPRTSRNAFKRAGDCIGVLGEEMGIFAIHTRVRPLLMRCGVPVGWSRHSHWLGGHRTPDVLYSRTRRRHPNIDRVGRTSGPPRSRTRSVSCAYFSCARSRASPASAST